MIIDVLHECEEGWHTFTSPHIPGLYLVGEQPHLQELYDEIPQVISTLAKADFGREVLVSLEKTYSSYLEELPDHYRPDVRHYSIQEAA